MKFILKKERKIDEEDREKEINQNIELVPHTAVVAKIRKLLKKHQISKNKIKKLYKVQWRNDFKNNNKPK